MFEATFLTRIVRMLIPDPHSRLNKYGNVIAETGYLCAKVVDNETIVNIATDIDLRVRNCQERKRLPSTRKLVKLLNEWLCWRQRPTTLPRLLTTWITTDAGHRIFGSLK